MPRHITPGCTARRTQQPQAVEQHLPHQQQQVAGMVHAMEYQHAQAVYLVDQAPGFWRGRRGAVARHPFEHGTLPFVQRQALRPRAAPMVPEQLRAHVVEPLQTTQIPPQWRLRRQVVELGLQHPPLRARSQLRSAPAPARQRARPFGRVGADKVRCAVGHGEGLSYQGPPRPPCGYRRHKPVCAGVSLKMPSSAILVCVNCSCFNSLIAPVLHQCCICMAPSPQQRPTPETP